MLYMDLNTIKLQGAVTQKKEEVHAATFNIRVQSVNWQSMMHYDSSHINNCGGKYQCFVLPFKYPI